MLGHFFVVAARAITSCMQRRIFWEACLLGFILLVTELGVHGSRANKSERKGITTMLGYLPGALISPSVMHWITPQILLSHYNVSTAETCMVNISSTVQCAMTDFEVQYCVYVAG